MGFELVQVRAEKTAQRNVPKLVGASAAQKKRYPGDVVSTTVPGLAAKPIIDLQLAVASVERDASFVAAASSGWGALFVADPELLQTHRDGAQGGADGFTLRLGSEGQAASCSTTRVPGSKRSSSDG